jgi:hypothetical protein
VLFAAGVLAAVGPLFRHAGLAFVPAVLGYLLVWRPALLGRATLAPGVIGTVSFAGGFGITYAVALGYLHSRDALAGLVRDFWAFAVPTPAQVILGQVAALGIASLLLWFMAGRELTRTMAGWRSGAPPTATEPDAAAGFALTWLVAALAAALLRRRFAPADFLPLLPPLTLLAARGTAAIADDFWEGKLARLYRLGIAIPAALAFCAGLFHEPLYRRLLSTPVRARLVGDEIREHSGESDLLWVLGDARRAYVYAKRLPAAAGIALDDPGAALPPGISQHPPRFIIDAGGARSPDLARWLEERYAPEKQMDGARILRLRAP